jgi:hypothetical protein
MPNSTRRCKIEGCGKGGARSFNDLCTFHWDKQIEINIKQFVEDDNKKKGT